MMIIRRWTHILQARVVLRSAQVILLIWLMVMITDSAIDHLSSWSYSQVPALLPSSSALSLTNSNLRGESLNVPENWKAPVVYNIPILGFWVKTFKSHQDILILYLLRAYYQWEWGRTRLLKIIVFTVQIWSQNSPKFMIFKVAGIPYVAPHLKYWPCTPLFGSQSCAGGNKVLNCNDLS